MVRAIEHGATFGLVEWESHDGSWSGFRSSLGNYIWEGAEWTSSSGLAIAAVWILLILSRRWKSERGWIDNIGTCLGIYWVLATPFSWFANWD